MLVPVGDVPEDGRLQLGRTPMGPAADLLLGQHAEPALDQVDPGRPRGSEVPVEPRVPEEPAVDRGRLMRPVVVEDEMHVQAAGTASSMVSRNLRNSIARWRRWHSPITVPVFTSRAANSDVVPYRV